MLSWALTFLIIAIVTGLLGYTGIAGAGTEAARLFSTMFFLLFLIYMIVRALTGRTPPRS